MRGPLTALVALLAVTACQALTVNEIAELSRAGISDDVIIAQLKADGSVFPLSSDLILALRGEGVSDRVIMAMIQARPQLAAAPQPLLAPDPYDMTLAERRRYATYNNGLQLQVSPVVSSGYTLPVTTYNYCAPQVPVTYYVGPNPPLFVNGPVGNYPLPITVPWTPDPFRPSFGSPYHHNYRPTYDWSHHQGYRPSSGWSDHHGYRPQPGCFSGPRVSFSFSWRDRDRDRRH